MGAGASSAEKTVRRANANAEMADKLFNELDANNDGVLTVNELYGRLTAMKHSKGWPKEKLKAVIADYDGDGDGKLSREEFAHVLDHLQDPNKKKLSRA